MSVYTEKTLKALREQGCEVDICERFLAYAGKAIPVKGNPHLRRKTGVRKDLFGIIDLIALRPIYQALKVSNVKGMHKINNIEYTINPPLMASHELVGIQCFGRDFAEHKRKVLTNKFAPLWLASGNAIELWGWRQLKDGNNKVWKPRVYRFQRGDFESPIPSTPLFTQGISALGMLDPDKLIDNLVALL